MSDDARLILDGLMARYPDADPATLAILRRLAPLLVNGDPSEIAALQRLLAPATEAKAVEAGPLAAWPPDWTQKLHPDEQVAAGAVRHPRHRGDGRRHGAAGRSAPDVVRAGP